jgi:hypothetical protein
MAPGRRLAGALVGMAMIAIALAFPAGAAAANAEIQPAEESVELILQRPAHHHEFEGRHMLELQVYPLRGVAIARTESNDFDFENNDAVVYAERIPKGAFDGLLDLHFKGLGSFVGTFVPDESGRERHNPKGCVGPHELTSSGSLVGGIRFTGAGGYARWSSSAAETFVQRSFALHCRKGAAEHMRKPKTLLDYVATGPGHFNNWRYDLDARRRTHHRILYLNVVGYESSPRIADFDAGVYEWLPGGIAASRSVNRHVHRGRRLEVSQDGYHPQHATLRPPSPFSGSAHYSRGTHRLTGTLAVRFPGLKLRVASLHTSANLVDEAGLREKSPTENP